MKKAEVEVQFNWIFVLIAGAIILVFFFIIIKQQISGSEEETLIGMKSDLDTFLKNAKLDSGSSDYFPAKGIELKYDCGDEYNNGYLIGGSSIKLADSFSPRILKSSQDKLIYWSLEWKVPYKASNFLYLTSPDIKYILIKDTNKVAETIFQGDTGFRLPEKVNKVMIEDTNYNALQNTNNYKVRIIRIYSGNSFNPVDTMPIPTELRKEDVSYVAIYVSNSDRDMEHPEIQFYKRDGNSFIKDGLIKGVGVATLYAAIFSEDKTIFECGMKQALKHYNLVTLAHHEVVEEFKMSYSQTGCSGPIYVAASARLVKLDESKVEDSLNQISNNFNLFELESRKARSLSCPYIY